MGILAKRLAFFRAARGFSQQMLAEKAGVPQSAISDIETGKRKNPGYQLVLKLARALGISANGLLADTATKVVGNGREASRRFLSRGN